AHNSGTGLLSSVHMPPKPPGGMPSGVLPSGAGGVISAPRLGGGSNLAVAPRQLTGTQAQPSVQGPARAVENQPRSADISAYGGNWSPKINEDPLGDDTGLGKELDKQRQKDE